MSDSAPQPPPSHDEQVPECKTVVLDQLADPQHRPSEVDRIAADTQGVAGPSEPATAPHEASASPAVDGQRGPTPQEINTLEAWISYAYQEAGKKLTAPKATYDTIERATKYPLKTEPGYHVVAEHARTDRLLVVPIRLLVHLDDAPAPSRVRRRVLDCVGYAMRTHSVFIAQSLQEVLRGSPLLADQHLDELRRSVERLPAAKPGPDTGGFKPVERARLLANATSALLLLVAMRDGWKMDRYVQQMYRWVWSSSVSTQSRAARRPAIADARNPEVLVAVVEVFDRQRETAIEDLGRADVFNRLLRDELSEVSDALESTKRLLEERDRMITDLRMRVVDLESKVEGEQRNRLVDRSHHTDDYHRLRTRIVRLLDKQAELLRDGLHALREDRVSIADEFIERILDAFDRERHQLKSKEELG